MYRIDESNGARKGFIAASVLILMCCLYFAGAHGTWKSDGTPICTAESDQTSLVTAPDGSGGMFLIWKDERPVDPSMYIQRIDSDGNVVWEENGIMAAGSVAEVEHPWICSDGNGGAWFTWCRNRPGDYGWIYLTHIDSLGNFWNHTCILDMGNEEERNSNPVCAPDGVGGVMVAWISLIDTVTWQRIIKVARVNMEDIIVWVDTAATDIAPYQQIEIATNEDQGFGVFLGWRSSFGNARIQWVDLDGNARWGDNGHNVGIVAEAYPVKVADRPRSSQGLYVMWNEGAALRVAAYDSSAYKLWTELLDHATGYSVPGLGYVLLSHPQGVFCVWDKVYYGPTGEGMGIYAQHVDNLGDPVWSSNVQVSGSTAGNKLPTAVLDDVSTNVIVSWVGEDGGKSKLKYNMVLSGGYAGSEMLVPGGYSSQTPGIQLEAPGTQRSIIAWVDERGVTETDIYAAGMDYFTPSHPDLAALEVTPEYDPGIAGGGSQRFYLTVANVGTSLSGSFWTTIFPNQVDTPLVGQEPPSGVVSVHCPPLAKGDTTVVEVWVEAPTSPETWSMWGFADYKGEVDEFGDEENNILGPVSYQWSYYPELVIESVSFSNYEPEVGDSITATIRVRNTGDTVVDSFYIDFYRNWPGAPSEGEIGTERKVVRNLVAGGAVTWTTSPTTCLDYETWKNYFRIDTDGFVAEKDESNNLGGPYIVSWHIKTEDGWPVAVDDTVLTSPAVANMDMDPDWTLEVVFVTKSGDVYALDAGASVLPGWPVSLPGAVTYSSPAVGDITGDCRMEVVVGDDGGEIYTIGYDGTTLWTYDTGGMIFATPALADLDDDGKSEVICGSNNGFLYVLNGDGSDYPGSWPYYVKGDTVTSAAVGDVDGDGDFEVAVISATTSPKAGNESTVYLFESDGTSYSTSWPITVSALITSGPVMGNVGGGPGLEIAAGDLDGNVYVWIAAGTHWPVVPNAGGRLESSPALADLDKDGYLELMLTTRKWVLSGDPFPYWHWEGDITKVDNDGSVIGTWQLGEWSQDLGPMPSPICAGLSRCLVMDCYDGRVHSDADGFPLDIGVPIAASAAAGDLDGDGRSELVVAPMYDSLYVFELSDESFQVDALYWPMYRHDRARTGCYGFVPPTAVDDGGFDTPAATGIESVFPNPFNPTVYIAFNLKERSHVELSVFDISGRLVKKLFDENLDAGRHRLMWEGVDSRECRVSSGLYFIKLEAGGRTDTRKVVLLR